MAYDVGDAPTVFVDFRNAAGVLAAPTEVTLTLLRPDGVTITVDAGDITNPSVGRYEHTFVITHDGEWFFRWVGAGAVTAAEEGRLRVRPRRVPAG